VDELQNEIVKNDIQNRGDILLLLRFFYQKLLNDDSINYIFTDVAKVNLEQHFPILANFWEMVIFQKDTYRSNTMQIHMHLNSLTPLTTTHFNTWIKYFNETIDEMFEGEKAFIAKQRALSIATSMQIKLAQAKGL